MQPNLHSTKCLHCTQWENYVSQFATCNSDNDRDSEGSEGLVGTLPCAMAQTDELDERLAVSIIRVKRKTERKNLCDLQLEDDTERTRKKSFIPVTPNDL
jgi:hypothetical protein